MTHDRDVDERLADWVDGRMTERERARFEGELRVNAKLRADLAEYERTVDVLRRALQVPTQPTAVADRVLARIAAGQAAAPLVRHSRRGFGPFGWSLFCAAALMLLAVMVDSWSVPPALDLVAKVPDDVSRGDSPAAAGLVSAEKQQVPLPVVASEEASAPVATTAMPKDALPSRAAVETWSQVRENEAVVVLPTASVSASDSAPGPTLVDRTLAEETKLPAAATPGSKPAAGGAGQLGEATSEDLRDKARTDNGAPSSEVRRGSLGAPQPAGPTPGVVAPVATAATMIAMLDIEGVMAPAPVPVAGESRDNAGVDAPRNGNAGEQAKGGASKSAAAQLTDEELRVDVQAFFASELTAAQPRRAAWLTKRGALQMSPLVLAAGPDVADKEAKRKVDESVPAARELVWLVEGDRDDVQLLLARVGELVRERKWQLRSAETLLSPPTVSPASPLPAPPAMPPRYRAADAGPAAAGPATGGPPAASSVPAGAARQQLVLRFRLRSS